ncbi:hypothetical protein [Paenirhodobacter enshiensis]|uniref:hypothetical protein n=1 Tax=Paenirhodobacter enshiensis TaxID=1105367 RepID=UPI0035B44852
MKAAVRCNSLNIKKLIQQELHGKRLDQSGQRRRINDTPPLIMGDDDAGLDLCDRLSDHIDGAKQNAAALKEHANVALHFIVKYPKEVLDDDGPTPFAILSREQRKARMMNQAIAFINETHGGNAVFAARLDRDEKGETVVDVFAAPRYEKETRKGSDDWVSLTKFGKALAVKHQEEVARRSPEQVKTAKGKPITSPRAIGMSLQSEFAAFFKRENGVALSARSLKENPGPDRLGIDEWKAAKAAMEEEERLSQAAREEEARLAQVAREEAAQAVQERDNAKAEEDEARGKAQRITSAIRVLADEIAGETLSRGEDGKLWAANPDGLKGGYPDIRPAVNATADAVTAKRRLEAEAAEDRRKAAEALKDAETAKTQAFSLRRRLHKVLKFLLPKIPLVAKLMPKTELAEMNAVIEEAQSLIQGPQKPDNDSESLGM